VEEDLETQVHYADLFFRPPDSRANAVQVIGDRVIRSLDLRSFAFQRRTIDAGHSWPEWRALADGWIREGNAHLEGQGLALDPVLSFELSDEGQPTSCLLRLKPSSATPPDGWFVQPDRLGLALVVPDAKDIDGSTIELLQAAVTFDARAGLVYLRIAESGFQIYLPLEPQY